MSKEQKRSLRTVATVMVVLAMAFAFAISGVRLFGLQVYGVLTGSMEPAYPTGSLVYVKRVDPATLKVNDVITFSVGRNTVATHRIVEKVPDPSNPYSYSFRTKGDANENVDNALVAQSNIVGKVILSIPTMGYVASYIQKPPGTYVAIFASLVLIAFVFITDSVDEKEGAEGKKEKKNGPVQQMMHKYVTPFCAKYLPFLVKEAPQEQPAAPPSAAVSPQMVQQYPQYPTYQQQYPQQGYPQYPQQPVQQQMPQHRQVQQPVQQYPQYPAYQQQYPQQGYPQYPQQPVQQQMQPQQYAQQQYPQQGYPQYPQQQMQPQQYPQQPYPQQPAPQQYPAQQPQQQGQYPQQPSYPAAQQWLAPEQQPRQRRPRA